MTAQEPRGTSVHKKMLTTFLTLFVGGGKGIIASNEYRDGNSHAGFDSILISK